MLSDFCNPYSDSKWQAFWIASPAPRGSVRCHENTKFAFQEVFTSAVLMLIIRQIAIVLLRDIRIVNYHLSYR